MDSNHNKRNQNSASASATSSDEQDSAAIAMLDGDAGDASVNVPPRSAAASDAVEDALARALEGATTAGRWDVVGQLARELEARRLAHDGNVVSIERNSRKR